MSGCSPRMFLLISGDSWMILDGLCEKNERKDLGCLIMSYLRQRCSSSKFPTSTHTNCQIDGWYWYVHCSHNSLLLVPLFNSCKWDAKSLCPPFGVVGLGAALAFVFPVAGPLAPKPSKAEKQFCSWTCYLSSQKLGLGFPSAFFTILGTALSSFKFQVRFVGKKCAGNRRNTWCVRGISISFHLEHLETKSPVVSHAHQSFQGLRLRSARY